MLGVVQTAEGLSIQHEVFAGNAVETATLVPTLEKVLARSPIRRVALVLYGVLRMRLKANLSPYSPEHALEIVGRIQSYQVTLHQRQTASGLTTLTPVQKELFHAVNLPEPDAKAL